MGSTPEETSIEPASGIGILFGAGGPTLNNSTRVVNLSVRNCTGIGIKCNSHYPTLENLIIENNNQGGIKLNGCDYPILTNVRIINNISSTGGGIEIYDCFYVQISKSIISGNFATTAGGGVYISGYCAGGNVNFNNCVISGNKSYNSGAGVKMDADCSAELSLNWCTITGNLSEYPGGAGISYVSGSYGGAPNPFYLHNSIIWDNKCEFTGYEQEQVGISVGFMGTDLVYASITNCDFHNMQNGLTTYGDNITLSWYNNVSYNPKFITAIQPNNAPTADGNFHLDCLSPCINYAVATVSTDIEWNPRPNPAGENADIGAYEMPGCPAKFDLFIKDASIDDGHEPQPNNAYVPYFSPDIWNRLFNIPIGEHQNPEYSPINPNYLFVRIHNRGNISYTPGDAKLYVYWTRTRPHQYWRRHWIDDFALFPDNYTTDGYPLGQLINPEGKSIPALGIDESVVLSIPWSPPNPTNITDIPGGITYYGVPEICLLARIESSVDQMYYESFYNDYVSILTNIMPNNNIAILNTALVDLMPNGTKMPYNLSLNPYISGLYSIDLIEITNPGTSSGSYSEWGNIAITFTQSLFDRWINSTTDYGRGFDINVNKKTLLLIDTIVKINNLPLITGENDYMIITFDLGKTKNPLQNYNYLYQFSCYQEGVTESCIDYFYKINVKKPDSLIAAITDSTFATCAGACDGTATVTAYGGTPPYTYQWGLETESQTTATATGLCEGRYSVTVTDSEGSTFVTSVNIIADPALFNYTGETTLTANTTWDGENFRISDKITVPADITLQIINSTIEFGSTGGIYIDKGGKLVVDKSNVTSLSGCTNMWGGIMVVGEEG
ncbi:MAG: right-handed parallel beta-helix repeat-containing protein, partial [Bacteroidia bacterium]|nr:right-handed parallel beta-helix repeat-containing protein [Bacteroidia bacterium]